jgi:hypothetical protein
LKNAPILRYKLKQPQKHRYRLKKQLAATPQEPLREGPAQANKTQVSPLLPELAVGAAPAVQAMA